MSVKGIPFVKMHGLGNDFIVIDDFIKPRNSVTAITPELARKICDRRFGVGADQVLWLRKPQANADVRMDILNADGSTAEMCGNGIRAVALYLAKEGAKKPSYKVETLAGLLEVRLNDDLVTVDMGKPVLSGGFPREGESLRLEETVIRFFEVSMGNPHAVVFVDRTSDVALESIGPRVETHSRFPKRTNVEFVEVKGSDTIIVRVWERGAGVTLACGTGACAAAVATIATGRAKSPLNVDLPGGRLRISWAGEGYSVMMEGPATEVFRGEYLG